MNGRNDSPIDIGKETVTAIPNLVALSERNLAFVFLKIKLRI